MAGVDYVALNTKQTHAESDTFTAERYRQMGRFLTPRVSKVLDVGCANGRGGSELKKMMPDIKLFGLDCVRSRIDQLPTNVYQGGIFSFSTDIDAPAHSFDAIVAGEFIEHLTYKDVIATLEEFHRLLRNCGTLVMTTPYPNYLRNLHKDVTTAVGAHLSAHFPKQLSVMMRDAGFRNVHWRGSGKMTRLIGEHIPILALYGSFLITGTANHDNTV